MVSIGVKLWAALCSVWCALCAALFRSPFMTTPWQGNMDLGLGNEVSCGGDLL